MSELTSTWSVDLTKLIAPLSSQAPTGEALRYATVYDRIREARREDDPSLAQGVWERALKQADWSAVEQLCLEALTTQSKDLQIAAWLLEAWCHLQGVVGVVTGLQLITQLCDAYWATLHPALTGDNSARLAPLYWLNEKLALTLKQIPMTQPRTNDAGIYTWIDRENALRLDKLAKKNANLLQTANSAGAVTLARFRESVMLSPSEFYLELNEQLNAASAATQALQTCLEAQCGATAPTLSQFAGVLREMQQMTNNVLTERNQGESAADQPQGQPKSRGKAKQKSPGAVLINSRDEAYQMLAEIAEYLIRVEPHSPAPYLIKRVVAWGSMSLTDLLLELVQSSNDRHAIFALLGIKEGGDAA